MERHKKESISGFSAFSKDRIFEFSESERPLSINNMKELSMMDGSNNASFMVNSGELGKMNFDRYSFRVETM